MCKAEGYSRSGERCCHLQRRRPPASASVKAAQLTAREVEPSPFPPQTQERTVSGEGERWRRGLSLVEPSWVEERGGERGASSELDRGDRGELIIFDELRVGDKEELFFWTPE